MGKRAGGLSGVEDYSLLGMEALELHHATPGSVVHSVVNRDDHGHVFFVRLPALPDHGVVEALRGGEDPGGILGVGYSGGLRDCGERDPLTFQRKSILEREMVVRERR